MFHMVGFHARQDYVILGDLEGGEAGSVESLYYGPNKDSTLPSSIIDNY